MLFGIWIYKFDLFYQKVELDYNKSMENSIIAEVSTISDDDDDDIDEPVTQQTGMNFIGNH